jgi:hemolysin activation/secretion protein
MLPFAQLVAPPLQPGPIRLPDTNPLQRPKPAGKDQPIQWWDGPPSEKPVPQKHPPGDAKQSGNVRLPNVEGNHLYSKAELASILQGCAQNSASETLQACAAALTARYVTDGYINTRVYANQQRGQFSLLVVEGRIAEVRLSSNNPNLTNRLKPLVKPLQGQILHLASLQAQLNQLRRFPGVGQVKAAINRLGSDASLAVLNLKVEALPAKTDGEIALRNDGNNGTGEARATAVLSRNEILKYGDNLFFYAEADASRTPELGTVLGSISYSYPLNSQLLISGSFGYSHRNLVELSGLLHNASYRQLQGYGQVEWTFKETLSQRWYGFAGLSINRNDSYLSGESYPLLDLFSNSWITSGYGRFGLGAAGFANKLSWNANAYILQGISGFSDSSHLASLGSIGIVPGSARAYGGSVNLAALLLPRVQFNLRGAGQIAENPLPSEMGFTLGSDTGLRGLPGQLISGDSGYLATAELAWSLWQRDKQSVQLVPFIGYGNVSSNRVVGGQSIGFSDGIGSGGLLARWIADRHWLLELGWVNQFSAENNPGYWNNWLLGNGLYTKVQYRF